MIRVTADSNIYTSALQFRGTPLRLLQLAVAGAVDLAISDHLVEEVTRTLREKFEWSEARIEHARRTMAMAARHVVPRQDVDAVKDDPDDNRILECAVAARSEYIVTGDKDLHRLGKFGDIGIVKIADLLDLVQGPEWRSKQTASP